MAPPIDEPLLRPPPGWHQQGYLSNLACELSAHRVASTVAVVLVVLLLIGRAILPAHLAQRLRTALLLLCVFVITIFGRALFLTLGHDGAAYEWLALLGLLSLAFGIISVSMLILYDLVVSRFGVPRIARDIVIFVAWGSAAFWLFSRSGVNIVQLVTTSAVVTAIIGLSLQDTLGNIIGGVALQVDSAVSLGDWIRVDDKVTGRVREVRWRSTLIETKDGDYVLYPNAVLNRSMVTVFQSGNMLHRQWVYFHVHLRHPPNEIIAIVTEALVGTPNISADAVCECLLLDFDDSGAKYVVRYRLIDYQHDVRTDSDVRKRIWYAMHRHQIEIPYPGRSIKMKQDNAEHDREKHERDIAHRMRALKRIPIFAPLSDEERLSLAEGLQFFPFSTGEVILRQREPGDSLYIIRHGEVSVCVAAGEGTREVTRLKTGDFFGEMSLLTGAPRRATISAVDDVECYVIHRAQLERLLCKNPPLADAIALKLADRQRELVSQELAQAAHAPAQNDDALLARIRHFFRLP
jgi:small-conductance mechanosensitive channel/CRP-like cAMP-binding protein